MARKTVMSHEDNLVEAARVTGNVRELFEFWKVKRMALVEKLPIFANGQKVRTIAVLPQGHCS